MAGIPYMPLVESVAAVLGTRTSRRLAVLLAQFPDKEFTGRELARMLGASPSTVAEVVRALIDAGFAVERTVGKANAIRLNRESFLVPLVKGIAEFERTLGERLHALVRKYLADASVSVTLFGSLPRGDASRRSDVDLLVVTQDRARTEDRLAALQGVVARAYGLRLSPKVLVRSDLTKRPAPPYLRAALAGGVPVCGKTLAELLG